MTNVNVQEISVALYNNAALLSIIKVSVRCWSLWVHVLSWCTLWVNSQSYSGAGSCWWCFDTSFLSISNNMLWWIPLSFDEVFITCVFHMTSKNCLHGLLEYELHTVLSADKNCLIPSKPHCSLCSSGRLAGPDLQVWSMAGCSCRQPGQRHAVESAV